MQRPDVLKMRQALAMVSFLRGERRTRDAAIVAIGCGFGLRVGDILALTWGDLLDNGGNVPDTVTVKESKTGKLRTLHVLPFVAEAVTAWRGENSNAKRTDKLFTITREHVWRIVTGAAEAQGLRGRITPHSLRKAFCDAVYEQTRDPVLTARVTGHTNPAQLMAYIGRTEDSVTEVWGKLAVSLKATAKGGR